MELILANRSRKDICRLWDVEYDFDIGVTNDFIITVSTDEYVKNPDLRIGSIVYVPNTEYGGIIGGITVNSKENTIQLEGMTWRGMMDKKIICPAKGAAYRKVTGDARVIIGTLLNEYLPVFFSAPAGTCGKTIASHSFNRYCTLLEGLTEMLKGVKCRLDIRYKQDIAGGCVEVDAVPIADLSGEVDVSQDTQIDFIITQKMNCVNHLICGGKGELADRLILDLYVQKNGAIGKTQYYKGIDEVVEFFDYPNAESSKELEEAGKEKLLELSNYSAMDIDIGAMNVEISIGDIVGGRDYLTGTAVKKPVAGKVLRTEDGRDIVEYSLEEAN